MSSNESRRPFARAAAVLRAHLALIFGRLTENVKYVTDEDTHRPLLRRGIYVWWDDKLRQARCRRQFIDGCLTNGRKARGAA